MGKTTEKLITFYPIGNDVEVFDVRFVDGVIYLGNRNVDATSIWIEISEEDWDEIVEFVNEQKEKNG